MERTADLLDKTRTERAERERIFLSFRASAVAVRAEAALL